MTRERAIYWISVLVLMAFGFALGQVAAVTTAAAAGAVIAYLNERRPSGKSIAQEA